jgi:hypothetical protein
MLLVSKQHVVHLPELALRPAASAASWASVALGFVTAGACLKMSRTARFASGNPASTAAEREHWNDSKSENTITVTDAFSEPRKPTDWSAARARAATARAAATTCGLGSMLLQTAHSLPGGTPRRLSGETALSAQNSPEHEQDLRRSFYVGSYRKRLQRLRFQGMRQTVVNGDVRCGDTQPFPLFGEWLRSCPDPSSRHTVPTFPAGRLCFRVRPSHPLM